eukprot:7172379-Prymnesium_polylepis.1
MPLPSAYSEQELAGEPLPAPSSSMRVKKANYAVQKQRSASATDRPQSSECAWMDSCRLYALAWSSRVPSGALGGPGSALGLLRPAPECRV